MNNEIRNALAIELETIPENVNNNIAGDIYELLSCAKEVQDQTVDESRWWNTHERVVELSPSLFVAYKYATSTGDSTPGELGWEYPSVEDIQQVFPKTVTITTYE